MARESWIRHARHHHEHARRDVQELHAMDLDPEARGAWVGLSHSLVALVAVQLATFFELRKLRRAVEAQAHHHPPHDNVTVRLNLTATVVAKEGTPPMPITLNPTETQDVEAAIAPVNAAGQPTSGPFTWSLSDGAAGNVTVAADTKSAKVVTNPGSIDAVLVVADPRTGISDTVAIQRTAAPPPDNNTTNLNLTGNVVDKA